MARNINAGGQAPSDISKIRAIAGLCSYLGKSCDDNILKQALETKQLFDTPLYFDTHVSSGYIYAYASFELPGKDFCIPSSCDIAQCDPEWLCTPGKDGKNGLLGISYRAISLSDQYRLAVGNALFQAEYLYGVKISASKVLKQSRLSGENFTVHIEQGDVDLGDMEDIPFHVSSQCRSGSTLFRHVLIADTLPGKSPVASTDLGWIQNPKYAGLDGAIGSVEKPVASGLVSDQIKLAIKRAAIQLAFEKSSDIAEDSVSITDGEGGLVQINQIRENTRTSLKARVISIHFEKGSAGFLKVFVWIAVIDG